MDDEEEEENAEDQDEHGNLRGLIDDDLERDGDEEVDEEGKQDEEGESDSGEEIGHRKRKRSKRLLIPCTLSMCIQHNYIFMYIYIFLICFQIMMTA